MKKVSKTGSVYEKLFFPGHGVSGEACRKARALTRGLQISLSAFFFAGRLCSLSSSRRHRAAVLNCKKVMRADSLQNVLGKSQFLAMEC